MSTPSTELDRTAPAELPERCAAPLLDGSGEIVDPVLLVDLDRPATADDLAAAARAAAVADRVVIGVGHGAPDPARLALVSAADLTIVPEEHAHAPELIGAPDPAAEAGVVADAVAAAPGAATVLAGLLRWSGQLGVPAALDAESLAYSALLGGPEFRRWLQARGPRPLPPPAVADPVLLERSGDRLRITLNRPERRNAYGREVRGALVEALELAELDPTLTRVVLDGAGPVFCAGGDLDEFGTTPDLITAHLVRTRGGAALGLDRLAERVEVRVHGACVGAGIELPAFAGRVVATPDATFRLPEVGMGLIPGAGGTVGIPARIGRWRTLYLALVDRPLPATTALAWGLIDLIDGAPAVS
jgi:enoyl-CoA hydratase/carnithine racemase